MQLANRIERQTVVDAKPAAESISVLFVDDEAAILRAITRSLRDAPFEVLTAWGPSEALKTLEKRRIDVLVSDLDMPEMSGLELTQIARRDHPDTVRMLLTGHATLEKALRAINDGEVVRFFTKPFEPVVFLEEMEALETRILKLRSQRDQHVRDAYQQELAVWMDRRFPGATLVEKNTEGEMEVDLAALLSEIDGGAYPFKLKDLLRREG